ncbi:unnamed protein product [Chrysoparadoxa australica]
MPAGMSPYEGRRPGSEVEVVGQGCPSADFTTMCRMTVMDVIGHPSSWILVMLMCCFDCLIAVLWAFQVMLLFAIGLEIVHQVYKEVYYGYWEGSWARHSTRA